MRRRSSRAEEAAELDARAAACVSRGELDLALELYRQALQIHRAVDPQGSDTASDLERVAFVHAARGELERALEHYGEALSIVRAIAPGSSRLATLLSTIGSIYHAHGDLKRADHYEQSLLIDAAIDPRSPDTARDLKASAVAYEAQGDLDRALPRFRQLLEIHEAVAPFSIETEKALMNVGFVHESKGELDAAAERYQRALEIMERIDPGGIETARIHNSLGTISSGLGDVDEALRHYQRAFAIVRATGEVSPATAIIRANLGSVYQAQGELGTALEHFQCALEINKALDPNSAATAANYNQVGSIQQDLGNLDAALASHHKALEIDADLDSRSMATGRDLASIGWVEKARGDLAGAMATYRQALEIVRMVAPGSAEMAAALSNVGSVYYAQGDLERALDHYQRALAISMALSPASTTTADFLTNVGSVHDAQGDLSRALEHYRRALAIDETVASRSTETARDLNNIGSVLQDQGDLSGALDHVRRALRIQEGLAPASIETGRLLGNVGSLYHGQGELERAREHYLWALAIHEAAAAKSPDTALDLNNLGGVYHDEGDRKRALGCFRRALGILEEVVPRSNATAAVLTNIGAVLHAEGDLDGAIEHMERAVEVAESLRARAGDWQAREGVFEQLQSPYQGLIAVLFERNGPGDRGRAFDYGERSRARTLVEMLAERDIKLHCESPEQRSLLDEERRLRHKLAAAHNRLMHARSATHVGVDAPLLAEQAALAEQLDRVVIRLRSAFPAYAEIRYPEPLHLVDVQARLSFDTLLLAYDATGTELFVWAARTEHFTMAGIDTTPQTLKRLLDSGLGAYRRGEAGSLAAIDAHAELSGMLLNPVPHEAFVDVRRVVVVPDGLLAYLPFEILPLADGTLLGDRYPISYAPSATAYDNLRRRNERQVPHAVRGQFVGFGDPAFVQDPKGAGGSDEGIRGLLGTLPALPGTREELQAIAEDFGDGAAVYLGESATECRAKADTAGYRFVHFATHGVLDDRNPLYSGLVLAPPTEEERRTDEHVDDILQVYEMFELDLAGSVVVCSACQTGLGSIRGGEGLVGMSQALFFAGARCVIASLWPVPDRPTARLMQRFYAALRRGVEPAEALAEAKISVRRTHPFVYEDPSTWAAFVSVGRGWSAVSDAERLPSGSTRGPAPVVPRQRPVDRMKTIRSTEENEMTLDSIVEEFTEGRFGFESLDGLTRQDQTQVLVRAFGPAGLGIPEAEELADFLLRVRKVAWFTYQPPDSPLDELAGAHLHELGLRNARVRLAHTWHVASALRANGRFHPRWVDAVAHAFERLQFRAKQELPRSPVELVNEFSLETQDVVTNACFVAMSRLSSGGGDRNAVGDAYQTAISTARAVALGDPSGVNVFTPLFEIFEAGGWPIGLFRGPLGLRPAFYIFKGSAAGST